METDRKSDHKKVDDNGAAEEVGTFDNAKDVSQVEVFTLTFENRNKMEKRLVRKLDMRLLPLMMLICKTLLSLQNMTKGEMLLKARTRRTELSGPKQHRHCTLGHT